MTDIIADAASVTVSRQTLSSSVNNVDSDNSRFVISKCRRNPNSTALENNNENEETTEDSEVEERLLAVYCRSGKLGAACYTLQTGELMVLEEIVDRAPDFQMFANLYRQIQPAKVLLEGKSQGAFVVKVKQTVFDSDSSGRGNCKLIFVSAREFSFEACKRRIYTLSLPNEPANCTEAERTIFIRTAVNFSQTQSVHALGALLRYLDLNWSSLSMELHSKPQFLSITKISLADIVTMDEDTYSGLQIFSSVSHPSNFKKGVQGSNKEGLSLFQVFSKCSSKVGQSRMRIFLQHPTRDLNTLKRRQDVVAFFMRPQHEPLMKNICSSLRFIKNVNGILAKIKALSAKPYQWKSLYNTLYNAVLICEMCEGANNTSEFLEELASCDNNKLYEMALYMNRIIDFDLSKSEGKFTVKAGVDPELDRKKQTMASLHGLMSETAKIELGRLPEFIQECTMLYMPHLGYLLGVKAWADNLTPQQKELPEMKFMFQNNDYIHYKSKGCEELDVMIGDAYPEIVAHETRIMMRLTGIVLEHLHTLATVIDKCAELDCLIAISKVSKEHNFVRPTMTTDKNISIKQGRHPLYSMTCESYVANDAESNLEAGLVKILTGPNSSGKSVYMKQIGLIVYLAHIGSFVPAESATIGVVSHIHSRIQSTECVAAHMSAFLIDLRQMALALQESTSNSLIIIDEFGKGTSEVDGLSLLAACLNTLLFQNEMCPHVILSTHFLNLKEYIVDTPIVKFLRFEHMLQDGEPVFLFQVTEGTADSSFAHHVAAASGIESRVVDRARAVMAAMMNNTLPPANKKITSKLRTFTEAIKNELLVEDTNS
ncbi:mutS protein homolog 5-like [Plodia interpunctella]|uniref:mutS protein homolog 5-like n=1 Tax=Plodia interpunctella TaxID=58824 RepID=UPI0023679165|nr:mutS protein homolog 5-like [Plodia interpunctella]